MVKTIDGFTILNNLSQIGNDSYTFAKEGTLGVIASPEYKQFSTSQLSIPKSITDIKKSIKDLKSIGQYLSSFIGNSNQKEINDFLCYTFKPLANEELKKDKPNLQEVFVKTLDSFNKYLLFSKENTNQRSNISSDIAGFIEKDNVIQYGHTPNFGVALFRENGKLKFKTDSFNIKKEIKSITEDKNSIEALNFGQIHINPGNIFLMYHNQLEELIESEEDMMEGMRNLPRLKSYFEDIVKKEASLIYLKK